MLKNIIILICIFIGHFQSIYGQDSGESIFDVNVVHEIRFQFQESNFIDIMNQNYEATDVGGDAPYIMVSATIDGEFIDSIGVRYKGFTSYNGGSGKNPMKLDFNEFVAGKRYDGLRKLNLNNATADPAMQRDFICYDLMNSIGVSAPRTSYAKVYYNDEYWGMYQVIEQVDKSFLKEHFSNDDGNLFKNLGWSKFEWLGSSKNDYKEIFSLKTNRESDDWSGFINFIDHLNNTTDQEFEEGIEDIFNVDLFLKSLAVDVATDNWDSYLEHGRNWYMYEDTVTDIIHWIPWDYNLSLGGQLGFGGGGDGCNLFPDFGSWTDGSDSVRFYNTSWPFDGVDYIWSFGDDQTSTEASPVHTYEAPGSYTVCLKIIEDEDCEEIRCKIIDTSYDFSTCNSIVNGSAPNEEVTGAFVLTVEFNPTCCSVWGEDCDDLYSWLGQFIMDEDGGGTDGGGGGIGFPIDQQQNEGVLIRRLLAFEKYRNRYYDHFCNLMQDHYTSEKYNSFIDFNMALIDEGVMEDPNFLFSYEDFVNDSGDDGLKGYISQRIESLQTELTESGHDCSNQSISIDMGDLVINELMASMDSLGGITDPSGQYDDWIEIHNNTEETIDLSNVYLSDSKTDLKKWKFPSGYTIEPRGYTIIWADKDEEQSGLHTNFKLNRSSDELRLSNSNGSIIDSLSFIDQETNIALARVPNGTGNFEKQSPTFGVNNNWPTSTNNKDMATRLNIYPNPTTGIVTIDGLGDNKQQLSISVMDATGKILLNQSTDNNQVDISTLVNGFYLIEVKTNSGLISTKKIIKI